MSLLGMLSTAILLYLGIFAGWRFLVTLWTRGRNHDRDR